MRFAMREGGRTVGAGIVSSVLQGAADCNRQQDRNREKWRG
jgi:hypothetical protein